MSNTNNENTVIYTIDEKSGRIKASRSPLASNGKNYVEKYFDYVFSNVKKQDFRTAANGFYPHGTAILSDKDNYDEQTGKDLAYARMLKKEFDKQIKFLNDRAEYLRNEMAILATYRDTIYNSKRSIRKHIANIVKNPKNLKQKND